jgi:hypothetical protein
MPATLIVLVHGALADVDAHLGDSGLSAERITASHSVRVRTERRPASTTSAISDAGSGRPLL